MQHTYQLPITFLSCKQEYAILGMNTPYKSKIIFFSDFITAFNHIDHLFYCILYAFNGKIIIYLNEKPEGRTKTISGGL